MATVRMSNKLIDQMVNTAGKKFEKQNPSKEYADTAGDSFATEFKLSELASNTEKHIEETWEESPWTVSINTSRISTVEIGARVETYDEDGNLDTNGNYDAGGNYLGSYDSDKYKTFELPLSSPIVVPDLINTGYNTAKITVPQDNAIFMQCSAVDAHNKKAREELYEFKNKLRDTLGQFTTLNQALKASDNKYSALVPHETMQRVLEKDDRKKREQELAEIASQDIDTLSEVLLTDSLLGDD